MLISIVIPTCNRSGYLATALSAVGKETAAVAESEIIVVDDGSSPRERARNRQLCSSAGVNYICNNRNRGMAIARNRGIKQAQGEWIIFIDDDIRVAVGWGKAVVEVLARTEDGVVGIEGRVTGSGTNLWDREVEVQHGGACLTCHILYRKKTVITAGCFDERFEYKGPFHEDQELAIRILKLGHIVFEPSLSAVHLPRTVRLLHYLFTTPSRIEKILKADFYLYRKHPQEYHQFRHAKNFYGTYFLIVFKYLFSSFKRRTPKAIRSHPLQALVLALSCLFAQARALTMLPYFITQSRITMPNRELWFAAALPASSQGGVNRLMTGLAAGLSSRGYTVKMIYQERTTGGYPGFSLQLALSLLLRMFNPPSWIIARSTDAFFALLLRQLIPLKTCIILHNHGWEEYVHQIQCRLPASIIDNPVTWKAYIVRFPMLRATLKWADYCLCGTVDDCRWIGNRYTAASAKLRYVPNGVESPEDAKERTVFSPAFLSVGTLIWRKNIIYALELFRRISAVVPDATFCNIGGGRDPQGLYATYGERAGFIPSVPMGEIGKWYKQYPFFMHTARYEGGHSLALLEAMAHGAVPIISPVPSSCEVVVHGLNGIILDGNNPDTDAEQVVSLLKNRQLCINLSVAARKTAYRNRWERQVGRLQRVLEQGCRD